MLHPAMQRVRLRALRTPPLVSTTAVNVSATLVGRPLVPFWTMKGWKVYAIAHVTETHLNHAVAKSLRTPQCTPSSQSPRRQLRRLPTRAVICKHRQIILTYFCLLIPHRVNDLPAAGNVVSLTGEYEAETCSTVCAGQEYTTFGIDGAGTCYCFSTFNNPDGTVYDSLCNAECPGDTTELCGSNYTEPDFASMLFSAYQEDYDEGDGTTYTPFGCFL